MCTESTLSQPESDHAYAVGPNIGSLQTGERRRAVFLPIAEVSVLTGLLLELSHGLAVGYAPFTSKVDKRWGRDVRILAPRERRLTNGKG